MAMFYDYALPEDYYYYDTWVEEKKEIYFAHLYVKSRFWNYRAPDDEEVLLSKALLNFKDPRCTDDIKEYFMLDIASFVQTCIPFGTYRVTLIPCPPSKARRYSCIADAIQKIVEITETSGEETEEYLGLDSVVRYYDGTGILQRETDTIPMKYLKNKPTVSEVKETIECFDTEPSLLTNEIVLIDDITTTGTTMRACKEILIENGADPWKVHCFALAKTRR
jgi:hypothetical protein